MRASYVGTELELFASARRWKAYFAGALAPFVGGRVLEVGAGIGSNVPYLHGGQVREWTSLEPDPALARRIEERVAAGELPGDCKVVVGTLGGVGDRGPFDTILYLDVLEHIADDGAELARAATLLAPGGRLVVLAPAHPFLFSPFDAAVGHHRRYSARSLAALSPPGCRLRARLMLDSAGLLASVANRMLLRSAEPTPRQIAFWDRVLVPLSRVLDALLGQRLGKTVVAVWSRAA
ncbi:MAG TPA: methyltransferase domain-containing protein [Stellaceae bacterium]|nr:methyltransferase domain-containing protein [Stellaceae bacterium]